MIFSPAIVLLVIIASLYAALFHLRWGQRASELPIYWLVALIGFGVGHLVGSILPGRFLMIGDLHLLEGTLTCWLALAVAKRVKL